ncbi:MAG: hypothetical protein JWQ48_3649 [Conexibacter sp.]|nr:hypothetical protein [Conexibacter sp.]
MRSRPVRGGPRIVTRLVRGGLAVLVTVLAAPLGLGLLYLLRTDRVLAHGGHLLGGSLPLQQLAGDAAQPLARVALAFGLSGLVAGLALVLLTRVRAPLLALAVVLVAWPLLVLDGAVCDAIASSLTVGSRLTLQLRHGGIWFEAALLLTGTLLGALLARRAAPVEPGGEGHTALEHAHAARIVAAHGRDALDPFALREDKAFHFAAGGLLAYRVIGRTAVVGGDPIGPPGSAAAILADFQVHAAARGWAVAVTGVSPAALEQLRGCGLRALQIGAEAVVDPRRFSLEGRRVRKVRQSVARVTRQGWRVEVVQAGELDDGTVAELAEVERRWRAAQRRLQGFAMTLGRLWGAEEDEAALYVVARDPDSQLRAFLRFVPYAGGISLDTMRRGGGEPNGLNEALVVAALRHAAAVGLTEVSLNFAGFAHVMMAEPGALGPRGRALRWALGRAHGRFQLERLARFNAKFLPTWQPRYLLYRGRRGLPSAGLRVLQAEAYVRAPRSTRAPQRWQPATAPVGSPSWRPARDPTHAAADALVPAAPRLVAGARTS